MTAPTLLGVDLGTSSVKVVVTDPDGRLLSQVSREYEVESANIGWAESDPRIWWRETVLAVREAVGKARDGGARVSVGGRSVGSDAWRGPCRRRTGAGQVRDPVGGCQGVGRDGRVRAPGQRGHGAAGEPGHPGSGRADPPVAAPVRRVDLGRRAVGAAAQGLAARPHDRGGPDRTQRRLGHVALRRARRTVGHGGDRDVGPGSGPLRPARVVGW